MILAPGDKINGQIWFLIRVWFLIEVINSGFKIPRIQNSSGSKLHALSDKIVSARKLKIHKKTSCFEVLVTFLPFNLLNNMTIPFIS